MLHYGNLSFQVTNVKIKFKKIKRGGKHGKHLLIQSLLQNERKAKTSLLLEHWKKSRMILFKK